MPSAPVWSALPRPTLRRWSARKPISLVFRVEQLSRDVLPLPAAPLPIGAGGGRYAERLGSRYGRERVRERSARGPRVNPGTCLRHGITKWSHWLEGGQARDDDTPTSGGGPMPRATRTRLGWLAKDGRGSFRPEPGG